MPDRLPLGGGRFRQVVIEAIVDVRDRVEVVHEKVTIIEAAVKPTFVPEYRAYVFGA